MFTELVSVPALPYKHHQSKLSITALARPHNAIRGSSVSAPNSHTLRLGHLHPCLQCVTQSRHGFQFPKCCILRGARPYLPLFYPQSWLTCPFPSARATEKQGQLPSSHDLCSPKCLHWGGTRSRRHLSPSPGYQMQRSGGDQLPSAHILWS